MLKTIIENIEDHVKPGQKDENLAWRLDNDESILNALDFLDENAETVIWSKLKQDNLLIDYSLNKDRFTHFEETGFSDDYELITKRLRLIGSPNEKVIMTWFSMAPTVLTGFEIFRNNWDDFFLPSADDLIVFNVGFDWMIYIAHFELFQYGSGIKSL